MATTGKSSGICFTVTPNSEKLVKLTHYKFGLLVLPQLADLSTIYKPNQLFASVRAQKEFLSALEEAATSGSTEPAIRIAIAQLAFKLTKAFEIGPCR